MATTKNTICAFNECDRRDIVARGYCNKHYQQGVNQGWIKQRKQVPTEEKFQRDTQELPNGCLLWTGALNEAGYGLLYIKGKFVRAHRYAWERVNGPIPAGLLIDHICHNRACCAVAHLRLATRAQNNAYRKGANPNNKTSGVRGVTWNPQLNKWQANVHKGGKNHYCGVHATIEEASKAAAAKRAELFEFPEFDPTEFSLDTPGAA